MQNFLLQCLRIKVEYPDGSTEKHFNSVVSVHRGCDAQYDSTDSTEHCTVFHYFSYSDNTKVNTVFIYLFWFKSTTNNHRRPPADPSTFRTICKIKTTTPPATYPLLSRFPTQEGRLE